MDVSTELYLKYVGGNTDALHQLVEMYSDGLVRFAYCFVASSDVAEDIMEDTFAAVIATKRHFSPRASFKTYLYKIARNKCIDYIRFHKKFVPLCDLENVLVFNDVETNVEKREEKRLLYKCLQQLPREYRDVLQLSYLEGFDTQEICSIMRKNTKQVYNLLARAKQSLKILLKKEGIE
ncbi:MAG: RNA polymerase sigma factor [Clostridiales bacterium]|nr:RNA polymerase sigma factor [Clostridiales bacterium]